MGLVLDLMLLLGMTKLGIELAPHTSLHVWGASVIVVPFCLGLGGAFRSEPPAYIRNYTRVLIGQVLTFAIAIVYVTMLSVTGLAAFIGLFVASVVFYLLGRLFGMTLRVLPLVLVCLAIAWVLAGGQVAPRGPAASAASGVEKLTFPQERR